MTAVALAATALSFRFAAERIIHEEGRRLVLLSPVHSSDPDDPNKSYSKYMPNAKFEFACTNSDVFDLLEAGVIYQLLMVREDSGAQLTYIPPQPVPVEPSNETGAPNTGTVLTDPASTSESGVTGAPAGDPPADPPIDPTPPVPSDPPATVDPAPAPAPAPAPEAPQA